jgi:hypothetical protein
MRLARFAFVALLSGQVGQQLSSLADQCIRNGNAKKVWR